MCASLCMSLAHEWHARVASWPALRGATLQDVQAGTLNKRLRNEVLEVVSEKTLRRSSGCPVCSSGVFTGARAQTRSGSAAFEPYV